MDLQLATVEDMAEELRRRKVWYALVAVENTNRPDVTNAWVAGQGESHLHVMRLCRIGARAFRKQHNKDAKPGSPRAGQ